MNDSERTAIEKIKTLRNQKGLSQAKMAELLGISQTGYAKIESAVTENIALSVAVGIAKALNVGFNELFDIDGDSQKIDSLNLQIVELKKKQVDQEKFIFLQEIFHQNFKLKILEVSDYISKFFISDLNKGLASFDDDQRNAIVPMFETYNKVFQDQLVRAKYFSPEDIKSFNAKDNFKDIISKIESES